jgi:hypothetical protein
MILASAFKAVLIAWVRLMGEMKLPSAKEMGMLMAVQRGAIPGAGVPCCPMIVLEMWVA